MQHLVSMSKHNNFHLDRLRKRYQSKRKLLWDADCIIGSLTDLEHYHKFDCEPDFVGYEVAALHQKIYDYQHIKEKRHLCMLNDIAERNFKQSLALLRVM